MISIIFTSLSRFIILFTIALLVMPLTITDVEAKKRCKPYLDKLHKIQAQQRSGYSLKRGQSLRTKEDKAREKWWQCEHTSLAKFKAQNASKQKKKNRKVKKSKRAVYHQNTSSKIKTLAASKNKLVSFNQESAIVIKSKYRGMPTSKKSWGICLLYRRQKTTTTAI